MKKFFVIAAIAAAALVACNKDDNGKNGKDDDNTIKLEYRITKMNDYVYSYNADGKVASVVTEWDNRVFNYNGNKLTITNGEAVEYEITLNEQGFASEVKYGDGNVLTITYDQNGFFTEAKKNGEKVTGQAIEDNDILYWQRWDGDNNFWRMKDATYLPKVNVGQVQTHWAEDLGMSRWMFEARLFGNTSYHVLESCTWHNFGDKMASSTAVYDYEFDANGCITKEIKYYGEWNGTDFTGMDEETPTTFEWEKIK